MKNDKTNWRINYQIRASKLRVIGADGKQVGVLSLTEALEKARKENLDLVEIAPKANPPVAKIISLGKLKYEEEKKRKREKRGIKGGEVKEIRFSPFIGKADYQTRLGRIKEFLKEGNKIRAVVKFKGKELNSKAYGYNLLKQLFNDIGENINIDMEPKFIGRHLTCVISPTKGKSKENEKKTKN